MKKIKSEKWIVRCDGLKVGYAESRKKAEELAFELQQKTPGGFTMQFTVDHSPAN